MPFKKLEFNIPGLCVLEPAVYHDERGYFKETYNRDNFLANGLDLDFPQDNLSFSTKGILRGLHLQKDPFAQGKLVSCLKGTVQDVAVDLRLGSPTYGQYESVILSSDNHKIFYVPPGFAHGFLVLSEDAIFHYKCTKMYSRECEMGLAWDDSDLGIKWEMNSPLVSPKDQENTTFKDFNSPFKFTK